MGIEVKVGKDEQEAPFASFELELRKTLDGNYMIFDHADIDIMVMPSKNKIVAFPSDLMTDFVYGSQKRLFDFLYKKGVINPASVRGGNVYGSLEAELLPSKSFDSTKITLLNISKFIDEERPYFEFVEGYEDMQTDRVLDPDAEDSTELGEVPHEETKGTLRPGYNYGPYWQAYSY